MRRVIIYGDLHGCLEELILIRKKLSIQKDDIEVSVGDLINKGPHNIELLNYIQKNSILVVKGNNEEKIIKLYKQYIQTPQETLEKVRKHEAITLTQIDDKSIKFLKTLPYFIKIHNLTIVHAGITNKIDLSKPLEKYDREVLTLLRFLNKKEDIITSYKEFNEKYSFWSEIYKGHEGFVVFGHHPFTKPKIEKYAIGIDTGCVYGGKLTAITFPLYKNHVDTNNYTITDVKSKKNYFDSI
jgi:bis(5'-nucleosyl)-tetraphosphatase (symmetrical)